MLDEARLWASVHRQVQSGVLQERVAVVTSAVRAMHSDTLKGDLASASSDAGVMMGVLDDMACRIAVRPRSSRARLLARQQRVCHLHNDFNLRHADVLAACRMRRSRRSGSLAQSVCSQISATAS